jgi:PhzF family phenazine biosynthesis protein
MDMCGHATLAAAHILQKKYQSTLFDTKAGKVNIIYQPDGLIEIVLNTKPSFFTHFASTHRIAELLGITITEITATPAKISVGTPKVLVEINSAETLWSMQPNFKAIAQEIPEGIYLFVEIHKNLYYARQFNPATGIGEDPVTGIAAGALGVHLQNKNIRQFSVEQGHVLHKKGIIFVTVADNIKIGGYATIFDELIFTV